MRASEGRTPPSARLFQPSHSGPVDSRRPLRRQGSTPGRTLRRSLDGGPGLRARRSRGSARSGFTPAAATSGFDCEVERGVEEGMRIASLARAPLEIVHERIDAGVAHIGIALPIPLRVEQAALDNQRVIAASGGALPHPSAHARQGGDGSREKLRCRRASLNRRSGAVNRHERDVRMTCNSRSRAAARRARRLCVRLELESARCSADSTALARC